MGGPFWADRENGAWSIPKGEYLPDEDAESAARREFEEELGVPVPAAELIDLGSVQQSGGKMVTVWAAEGEIDLSSVVYGVVHDGVAPRIGPASSSFPKSTPSPGSTCRLPGPRSSRATDISRTACRPPHRRVRSRGLGQTRHNATATTASAAHRPDLPRVDAFDRVVALDPPAVGVGSSDPLDRQTRAVRQFHHRDPTRPRQPRRSGSAADRRRAASGQHRSAADHREPPPPELRCPHSVVPATVPHAIPFAFGLLGSG